MTGKRPGWPAWIAVALCLGCSGMALGQASEAPREAVRFPTMEPGNYQQVMRVIAIRGYVPEQARGRNPQAALAEEQEDFCYSPETRNGGLESIIEHYFRDGGEAVHFVRATSEGDQARGEMSINSHGSPAYARYNGTFQATSARFALELKFQMDETNGPTIVDIDVTWSKTDADCASNEGDIEEAK